MKFVYIALAIVFLTMTAGCLSVSRRNSGNHDNNRRTRSNDSEPNIFNPGDVRNWFNPLSPYYILRRGQP